MRRLLAYPPDSAGGLMTTEVARLPIGLTAGEAIERIRHLHEELEDLSYVYVIGDARPPCKGWSRSVTWSSTGPGSVWKR